MLSRFVVVSEFAHVDYFKASRPQTSETRPSAQSGFVDVRDGMTRRRVSRESAPKGSSEEDGRGGLRGGRHRCSLGALQSVEKKGQPSRSYRQLQVPCQSGSY